MDGQAILKMYERTRKMQGRGIKTFADAILYADKAGRKIAGFLDLDFSGASEEDIEAALMPVMRKAYGDAARTAMKLQADKLMELGIGIRSLDTEFDAGALAEISADLVGREVTAEYLGNLIAKHVVKGVDDVIQKNAEANDSMGLTVHIVRTYSGRGLMQDTKYAKDCEWCLSRCGEWTDYKTAKADGCFERHPGCLCKIDYQVGKIHTRSSGSGWQQG